MNACATLCVNYCRPCTHTHTHTHTHIHTHTHTHTHTHHTHTHTHTRSCVLHFLCFIRAHFSARYISRLAKRSALGGISLILLFVYKYITDVSFLIFNCVPVPFNGDSYVWVSLASGSCIRALRPLSTLTKCL